MNIHEKRQALNIFFTLSLIIVGVLECIIFQNRIPLIPFFENKFLISKWWYLIIPIGIVLLFIVMWFIKASWQVLAEDSGKPEANEDLTMENILSITSADIWVSLFGILMLNSPVKYVRQWSYSNVVYSYTILWLYVVPFISATLEFFSSFSDMEEFKKRKRADFKNGLMKNGIVTMFLMLVNLALLIWVADMTVCKYTYILYVFAFIARKRQNHITIKTIWPEETWISEEARNEGIK